MDPLLHGLRQIIAQTPPGAMRPASISGISLVIAQQLIAAGSRVFGAGAADLAGELSNQLAVRLQIDGAIFKEWNDAFIQGRFSVEQQHLESHLSAGVARGELQMAMVQPPMAVHQPRALGNLGSSWTGPQYQHFSALLGAPFPSDYMHHGYASNHKPSFSIAQNLSSERGNMHGGSRQHGRGSSSDDSALLTGSPTSKEQKLSSNDGTWPTE